MIRDGFVFYRSFYEALCELPPEDFKVCALAIIEYGLDGKEPETGGFAKSMYLMAKPQIDKNNQKYKNGTKGGRPEINQKPNDNQMEPNENQNEPNVENQEPKEKEKEKEKDSLKENHLKVVKEKRGFSPPTLDDVKAYCQEKGYSLDAERFVDFYESKGWYVGKNKMKDWKAALRNWSRSQRQELTAEGKGRQDVAAKPKKNRFHNFKEHDYDYDDLMKQAILGGRT